MFDSNSTKEGLRRVGSTLRAGVVPIRDGAVNIENCMNIDKDINVSMGSAISIWPYMRHIGIVDEIENYHLHHHHPPTHLHEAVIQLRYYHHHHHHHH